jgi:hypothetical protein
VQNLAVDTRIVVTAPTNAGTWLFVSADDSHLRVRTNKTSATVIEISRSDIVQVGYPKHHATAFGAFFGMIAGAGAASTGAQGARTVAFLKGPSSGRSWDLVSWPGRSLGQVSRTV